MGSPATLVRTVGQPKLIMAPVDLALTSWTSGQGLCLLNVSAGFPIQLSVPFFQVVKGHSDPCVLALHPACSLPLEMFLGH